MAWLAATFLTLRMVSSLRPTALVRVVERRQRRRHRNEHFSLFHLGMPQIVGDQKCEGKEGRERERGGGGPQAATNDSQTRIHRPRPPHNSRSAWRTAAAAGQQQPGSGGAIRDRALPGKQAVQSSPRPRVREAVNVAMPGVPWKPFPSQIRCSSSDGDLAEDAEILVAAPPGNRRAEVNPQRRASPSD